VALKHGFELVGVVGRATILAGSLVLPGCYYGELARPASQGAAGRAARDPQYDPAALLRRAVAARRAACGALARDDQTCVDLFYESAVFARFAFDRADDADSREALRARELQNESLADALRAATCYGRIDPSARWLINGPNGAFYVPVVHCGFVWQPGDFTRLVDARDAPPNPYQKTCHRRRGLGAAQVVVRPNPRAGARDRFLRPTSFFPATAILRPDPGLWLETPGVGVGRDVLELHDPWRTRCVDVAGRPVALAADPDAAIAMMQNAAGGQRYTMMGFVNPSVEINKAGLGLLEPYQPGKVVVVFVHGLLDNPYDFSDAITDLCLRPGFLDKVQIAAFRYPTGITFLRSATILRRELSELSATYDPQGVDPGMRNITLVGYSMGGLLSKLQVTSSGDSIWSAASNRPIDSLVAPPSTIAFLRELFFFEPQPTVTRVVYIATPHDGSAWATRVVGRVAARLVTRPEEIREMADQLVRDNPGAFNVDFQTLPSSIDLLARRGPFLTAMQSLAVNPTVRYHTIAGTGHGPAEWSRGDLVVPLASALTPGATSELLVPATHLDINRAPETIDELDRIMREHVDGISDPAG
jgi:pimeloyl-ACP methyl ester carboxylesterase